ncbi:N-acyl-D-amino-acid deacylase family protein [Nocardia cyriacigeorgica]|uniref:N-acyl-D-amino-acid deacylase family protein n=1 Tax=Nocardia cyriacigeorgica TaxID=135487 RepID=UPI001896031A|nr:amidohydrolase family protein [Nocardia cyriacigeorgica]MBF6415372.1 amidohydrolase family protein [Nocardia cyriacigeorgica]
MREFDIVVRGGECFDGTGAPPVRADIGIAGGRVAAVGTGLPDGRTTIDATGKWVIPGLIDVHTHYDAEVLFNPGLGESARHGVTTAIMGNCSLSTVYAGAEDCADLFARVEALPWDVVHDAVAEHKSWNDPSSYVAALLQQPLGVNVAAFLGHSDIRVAVMGLERASSDEVVPDPWELVRMREMLESALAEGFVGLSTIRSSYSKLDGKRYPGRQLPSTYARWPEFASLNEILRDYGRIHQSTPNLTKRAEIVRYFTQSVGRALRRKPLKTSMITAADIKADRTLVHITTAAAAMFNRVLGADYRWQHLPVPFAVYADGFEVLVFEELGSGVAALNIRDLVERHEFLTDEAFRRAFRRDMAKRYGSRVWHRDLNDARVVDCPDRSLIGRSFADIAAERGLVPADVLLDLIALHGKSLRWHTTIANDREAVLDKLARSPHVQMGFSDSGAHVRNMAYFNMGIRLLERAHKRGFMPVEQAIHRLTGELAQWYGLDAGTIAAGARADLAVIDPAGFDGSSAGYHEAPMPGAGLSRMVNRNDAAVAATIVGGTVVYEDGEFVPGFGTDLRAGTFLRASSASGSSGVVVR